MISPLYILLAKSGDLMSFLPVCHDDFKHGMKPKLMVCKEYAPLLEGCSYVEPVVFDGTPWELPRAFEEAKVMHPKPLVVQTAGDPKAILELAFKPSGGPEHAITDSFQKEAWRFAGRMDLWKMQPPLVFDQRDAVREKKLLDGLPLKGKKPIILISADGTSSPFPYAELLHELIKLKFGRHYQVVDLALVKAERLFDLLALYERSHALVATDSAPLHLAWACPTLPVAALVNDRPNLWNGACWRSSHIWHGRYRDFPSRAISLLVSLETLDAPGSPFRKYDAKPKLIHVWSAYEVTDRARHNAAAESWRSEYKSELMMSCPVEVGALGRDSKYTSMRDDKRFPFVKDVIVLACRRANEEDVIVLTRADTCFIEDMAYVILDQYTKLPLWSHRQVKEANGYTHHAAVDLFAFTSAWWRKHQTDMPDMLLGRDPYWWRVLMELCKANGGQEVRHIIYRPEVKETLPPLENIPKRLAHNEELCRKFLETRKITCSAPPVSQQIETIPFNRRALSLNGYNPSIIRHNGRLLMAYRWHRDGGAATSLAMADLDANFNVTNNRPIDLPTRSSSEDARLFIHGGELWMCWVDSTWPDLKPTCVTKYGKLVEGTSWTVLEPFQPKFEKNDGSGMEKNWCPMDLGGPVQFIYQSSPLQTVITVAGNAVAETHISDSPHFRFGAIRGGSPPVPYDGKLLRFFHSSNDTEPAPYRRRYYMGAALMEPVAPFKIVAISKEPILRGSEEDELSVTERAGCSHRKPMVVFPAGCVEHGEGWVVSVGVNDSASSLVYIKASELKC